MSIIKFKKLPSEYITIHKYPHYNDNSISFKAKGILTYLVGHPDDWEVKIGDLIKQATDKEKSVRAGLQELRTQGYAKLYPERDETGKIIGWNWEVYELPFLRKDFSLPAPYSQCPDACFGNLEKPDAENSNLDKPPSNKASYPDAGFLHVGNRHITNKESNYKDILLLDRSENEKQEEEKLQTEPPHRLRDLLYNNNIIKSIPPSSSEEENRRKLVRQKRQLLGG